jgi:hypothetical protein
MACETLPGVRGYQSTREVRVQDSACVAWKVELD